VLLFALLGVGAAYVLCATGTRLGVFAGGVLAAGFFNSAVSVCFPTYMAHTYPNSHRRMFSLSLTVMAIPWLIVPFLVGRLVRSFPQQFTLVLHVPFLVAGLAVLTGALVFRNAPLDRSASEGIQGQRPSWGAGLRLLSRPAIVLIVALAVLHGAGDGVFATWFPVYATRQFGNALKHPGDVLALCGLAFVTSRLVLSLLPERLGQRALLIAPGLLGGSILLACLWANQPRIMFWGYPLAAFAWSWEYPTLLSEASSRAPRHFASVLAISIMATQLVSALLMVAIGVLLKSMDTASALAPWWQRDLRVPLTAFPLAFMFFGLLAAVSGLGRHSTAEHRTRGGPAIEGKRPAV